MLLIFFLSACLNENESCITNAFDTVRIEFRKLDRTNPRNDTLYFASVQAANGVFLNVQDTALLSIALPLNPSEDQATFYLRWAEDSASALQEDTLVFRYDREQRLVSPECGVEQIFVNLRSDSQVFDSLNVVDDQISLLSGPNVRVFTCQYEYTDVIRTRFLRLDTISLDPFRTQRVRDTMVVNQITDDRGNIILAEPDTLHRINLPVNTNDGQTTYEFRIVNDNQEVVSRNVQVTYFVDTVQIFDCLPQTRVANLDVDTEDYNFAEVNVDEDELNIHNPINLEIFF